MGKVERPLGFWLGPAASYQRPTANVLRFEAEHAILGDSDDDGTEPIIDDGSSQGWT